MILGVKTHFLTWLYTHFEVKLLPFMKAKEGSASLPVETQKRSPDEPSGESDLLEMAIKELFEAKTDKARVSAFKTAFQLLEQEPHEENNG